MKRSIVVLAASVFVLLVGCAKSLSPEEKAQVQALRLELDATKKDVATVEAESAKYSGGLIKALLSIRGEVLKTNQALLEQRIHSIESGAKVNVVTLASKPDPERAKSLEDEITKQQTKVAEAEAKSAIQGGLIGAMSSMAAATERNSLALLRQQYLMAKYGLALPAPSASVVATTAMTPATPPAGASAPVDNDVRDGIIEVTLLRKQYAEQDYQNFIFFDTAVAAKGLDKPARAIKGALTLTDLFGEPKYSIRWTIDKPLQPGQTHTEKGSGFKFNQFMDTHQWVRSTDLKNMKAKFRVDEILYEDGTKKTFD